MDCALRACCLGVNAKLQALIVMWPWHDHGNPELTSIVHYPVRLDIGQSLGARGNTQQWLLKHERSGTRHQIKDICTWSLRSSRLTTNATIWCSMKRGQSENWCSRNPQGHAVEHSKTGHCNVQNIFRLHELHPQNAMRAVEWMPPIHQWLFEVASFALEVPAPCFELQS